MLSRLIVAGLISTVVGASPGIAAEPTRPELILRQAIEGLPKGDKQEVQVLTARFEPGQSTVYHTHQFPVVIYMLEGTFTLEMEGRPPVSIMAGQSFVEPPHVKMTGYKPKCE